MAIIGESGSRFRSLRSALERAPGIERTGLALALIVAFTIFSFASATPPPMPADAPALEFSATRAMDDVRVIGTVPHPVGSSANAAVRDYLIRRLRGLGLSARVQRASSFTARGAHLSGATVENVIGIFPGRDRSVPALGLMAHRDTVPGSPGASDDSAGVASVLEIIRAIKARGIPARDIVVLFTDGEEVGSLGAKAFYEQDPLAVRLGYVLNLDTRGNGGRTMMFETGASNGNDVALFARAAKWPLANSLIGFLSSAAPNDTDLTVFKQHGLPGLNFGFIGRQFDYHAASSTPDRLDIGALQHMGAEVLPVAAALAFGPLPARSADPAYSDVFGLFVIHYPVWLGWILLCAAAGLVAMGIVTARRRTTLTLADVLRGIGTSLYIIAVVGAVLILSRKATGVGVGWAEYRPILARFALFEIMMLATALGALGAAAAFAVEGNRRPLAAALPLIAGIGCSLFGGFDPLGLGFGIAGALLAAITFGARCHLPGGWAGLLIAASLPAIAVQILAPTAAFIFTWPLIIAALAAAITANGTRAGRWSVAAIVLIATIAFAWLGGFFHTFLQMLDLPVLVIIPTWLAALFAWPLIVRSSAGHARLAPAGIVMGFGLAIAAYIHIVSPWSVNHPNVVEPVYIVDPQARRAWRASLTPPDAWSMSALAGEGGAPARLRLPFLPTPLVAATAAPVPIPAPQTSLSVGKDGRTTLTADIHEGAARLIVSIWSATPIVDVEVNGVPARYTPKGGRPTSFQLKAGEWGKLMWTAPQGFRMSFHTGKPDRMLVHTAEIYDRWLSVRPLPPRPSSVQAWGMAGSSLVLGTTRVN